MFNGAEDAFWIVTSKDRFKPAPGVPPALENNVINFYAPSFIINDELKYERSRRIFRFDLECPNGIPDISWKKIAPPVPPCFSPSEVLETTCFPVAKGDQCSHYPPCTMQGSPRQHELQIPLI